MGNHFGTASTGARESSPLSEDRQARHEVRAVAIPRGGPQECSPKKKSLPSPAGSGTANHAVAYHTLLPQTLLPKNASSVMIKPRFEIMMYFIVVPPCDLLTALVKSLVVSSGYGL